jgi:hypothetical protein
MSNKPSRRANPGPVLVAGAGRAVACSADALSFGFKISPGEPTFFHVFGFAHRTGRRPVAILETGSGRAE